MDLFNPFQEMIFDDHFCFLSGDLTTEQITVFPEWLMKHFKLEEEELTLMENSEYKKVAYKDLKLPCAPHVKKAFQENDNQFREAYKKGFEAVDQLDEKVIFYWSGRIVYGILYLEMMGEWERHQRIGRPFELAAKLRDRLGKFQIMLQSLIRPISFGERKPWSLVVFPLKYSADILSYRDDIINLLFQFGVNGFGFVICFQDNGIIKETEHQLLGNMKGYTLHPVQFEELYARFHYRVDLLQYIPQYELKKQDDEIHIKALPVTQTSEHKPLYGLWEDDFYARLLSNYWQVYGIEKGDIIRFQKPFLSFLENQHTKNFIDPESIELPF